MSFPRFLVMPALLALSMASAHAEMAMSGGGTVYSGPVYSGAVAAPPMVPNALPVLYVSTQPTPPGATPGMVAYMPTTMVTTVPQGYGYYSQGYYYPPMMTMGR